MSFVLMLSYIAKVADSATVVQLWAMQLSTWGFTIIRDPPKMDPQILGSPYHHDPPKEGVQNIAYIISPPTLYKCLDPKP